MYILRISIERKSDTENLVSTQYLFNACAINIYLMLTFVYIYFYCWRYFHSYTDRFIQFFFRQIIQWCWITVKILYIHLYFLPFNFAITIIVFKIYRYTSINAVNTLRVRNLTPTFASIVSVNNLEFPFTRNSLLDIMMTIGYPESISNLTHITRTKGRICT